MHLTKPKSVRSKFAIFLGIDCGEISRSIESGLVWRSGKMLSKFYKETVRLIGHRDIPSMQYQYGLVMTFRCLSVIIFKFQQNLTGRLLTQTKWKIAQIV